MAKCNLDRAERLVENAATRWDLTGPGYLNSEQPIA